jgi:hypothetical protein
MDKDALKNLTVADLKEQAKKIPAVKGLSSMKKDELIELILKHEHAGEAAPEKAPAKAAKPSKPTRSSKTKTKGPLDKSGIKQLIRALKQEKKDAISQQDHARARQCNRQIHDYKRRLRKLAGSRKQKQKQ